MQATLKYINQGSPFVGMNCFSNQFTLASFVQNYYTVQSARQRHRDYMLDNGKLCLIYFKFTEVTLKTNLI